MEKKWCGQQKRFCFSPIQCSGGVWRNSVGDPVHRLYYSWMTMLIWFVCLCVCFSALFFFTWILGGIRKVNYDFSETHPWVLSSRTSNKLGQEGWGIMTNCLLPAVLAVSFSYLTSTLIAFCSNIIWNISSLSTLAVCFKYCIRLLVLDL